MLLLDEPKFLWVIGSLIEYEDELKISTEIDEDDVFTDSNSDNSIEDTIIAGAIPIPKGKQFPNAFSYLDNANRSQQSSSYNKTKTAILSNSRTSTNDNDIVIEGFELDWLVHQGIIVITGTGSSGCVTTHPAFYLKQLFF